MEQQASEQIKQNALDKMRGLYVRGLPQEYAVKTFLKLWSNELLQAITGRSANQVSRMRTGRSKISVSESDAIYKFYLHVSEYPLPDDAMNDATYQNYPIYSVEEGREVVKAIRKYRTQLEAMTKDLFTEIMPKAREIRDNAPKQGAVVTVNGKNNDSVIETSPNVSTFKVQSKKEFLAQQQQAEEQAQAEREKQAQIPKDKNGKPLKPVHFTTGETKDGQPMLSTDGGMTWYRKPNFPVRDLTVLMAWDDKKFEGMDKYLTMKDRLIGELMQSLDSILIPQSETEWQKARNQAYDQHPAAFWKMYFKYGADDNFTLRQSVSNLEMMRKSSLGNPIFKTVEELHEFEDKMERYLTTHKSDFAPEDVAKYFDRDEDAMNIDGSYVAADEDEPINEVEYNTLYNFNGPYNKLF